jgi:RsiW-degrading membrane proteinase PrsW (M82 family)
LGFTTLAFTLSVLIASFAMAYIIFVYAKRTGRRKWMGASIFFIFALVMTLLAYYFGW